MQLEFTPETYARLEVLREKSNCATKTELIRQALAVFSFFIDESHKGRRIQSVSAEGEVTQIVVPLLLRKSVVIDGQKEK